MKRKTLLLWILIFGARPLAAQQPRDTADKTFFTRRDLVRTGAIVVGTAAVSLFDERIARWTQSARVQGGTSRADLVDNVTVVNEMPLTFGSFAAYGVGRLVGSETLADVGLHTTEALLLTVAITEVFRVSLGRDRPRVSPDNAFNFNPGRGFTEFSARSYPSIHAAVAFTTASALVEELRLRKPGAVKVVAPILYSAALIPGFTRMYLAQHWASDVAAGTFAGLMLGNKVVHYAHTHRRSTLDRKMLGVAIVPDGHGGLLMTASLVR